MKGTTVWGTGPGVGMTTTAVGRGVGRICAFLARSKRLLASRYRLVATAYSRFLKRPSALRAPSSASAKSAWRTAPAASAAARERPISLRASSAFVWKKRFSFWDSSSTTASLGSMDITVTRNCAAWAASPASKAWRASWAAA